MAGFEVEARLNLDALRRDLDKAKAAFTDNFRGLKAIAPEIEIPQAVEVGVEFKVETVDIPVPERVAVGVDVQGGGALEQAKGFLGELVSGALEFAKAKEGVSAAEFVAKTDVANAADLQAAIEETLDRVAELEGKAQAAKNEFIEMSRAAAQAAKEAEGIRLEINLEQEAGRDVAELREELAEASQNAAAFTEQAEAAKAEAIGFGEEAAGAADDLAQLALQAEQAKEAQAAFADAFSGAKDAVDEFFESSIQLAGALSNAQTSLSLVSDDVPGITQAMGELSEEFDFLIGRTELVGLSSEVVANGFESASDASEVLRSSIRGTIAAEADAEQFTATLTATLAAYGLRAEEGARASQGIADQLVTLKDIGVVEIDSTFSRAFGRLAATAAAAGVALEDVNAAVAVSSTVIDANQAVNGFVQAIANIQKPTAQARDRAEELAESAERLGIQFDGFSASALRQSGSLTEVVRQIDEVTRASGGDLSENLVTLFGSVEAVNAILPLTGAGFADVTTALDEFNNSAGKSEENFAKTSEGFGAEIAKISEIIDRFKTDAGADLTAALTPILGFVGDVLENLLKLPDPIRSAGVQFLFFGSAAVGGLSALAGFTSSVPLVIQGLKIYAATLVRSTVVTGTLSNAQLAYAVATGTATTAQLRQLAALKASAIGKLAMATASGTASAAQTVLALATGKTNLVLLAQAGAFKGVTAGAAAAATSVVAFAAVVAAAAAPLATLLDQTNKLRDANRSLAETNADVNAFSQGSVGTQRDLKEAAEARVAAQREGRDLTEAEAEAEAKALDRARQTLGILEEQLATAKEQQAEADKNRDGGLFGIGREAAQAQARAADELVNQLEQDIGRVEKRRDTLSSLAGADVQGEADVSIDAAVDAEVDTSAAEAAIDDAIDDAISSIEQNASQRSVQLNLEESQAELGALEAGSTESENFAIAQDFAARRIELARNTVEELRNLEAQNPGNEDIASRRLQAELDLSNAQKQRVESQIAEEKRLEQARKDSEEEAARAAEEAARKREEAEKKAVEAVERSQRIALDEVRAAETERSQLIAERELQLRQQGAAQADIERELAELSLQARRDSLAEQLAAQEQFIRDLEALPQTEATEDKIRAAKAQTAKISLDLVQVEIDAQRQLTQTVLDGLDAAGSRRREAGENAVQAIRLQEDSLNRVLSLERARADLASTLGTLAQEQIKTRIEEAKEAGDAAQVEELEKDLKAEQVQQERLAFEFKRRQLEIQAQQNSLQAESQLITAQIAESDAQIALAKARASGASAEEISNLEKALGLAQRQVGIAQNGIAQTERANDLARAQLDTEQQISEERRKQQAIRDGDSRGGTTRVRTTRVRTTSTRPGSTDPLEGVQRDRTGTGLADKINFPDIQKVQVVSLPPDPDAEIPESEEGEDFSPIVDTGTATVAAIKAVGATTSNIFALMRSGGIAQSLRSEKASPIDIRSKVVETAALLSGNTPEATGRALAADLDAVTQGQTSLEDFASLEGILTRIAESNDAIVQNTSQDRAVTIEAINVSSPSEGINVAAELLEAEAFG